MMMPPDLLPDLRSRYAEPHRAYHTWSHISAMLMLAEEVKGRIADFDAFRLAVLYHDAIYDPRATDNERRSAALMREQLQGVLPGEQIDRAAVLILATEKHAVPNGVTADVAADAATFLDIDLSILGAEPVAFAAYDAAIRREYAHVPETAYRFGRKRVLEGFLARERIFLTPAFRERFEAAARDNLARAIARLGQ